MKANGHVAQNQVLTQQAMKNQSHMKYRSNRTKHAIYGVLSGLSTDVIFLKLMMRDSELFVVSAHIILATSNFNDQRGSTHHTNDALERIQAGMA
ncbi:unnamed protein product [Dovyalis caffra]|uniref:Uncharacterized protein n=1 Tax=Dovyalis caffra TaxID=77055 RepID=A0AAV1S0C2_9ROSI|nr:unnamed protein product [Dovyalis caffra]